jgi:DNA-binding HxlR family transcriptional regulator
MIPRSSFPGSAAITENMLKRKWSSSILRYLDQGVNNPAEIIKREIGLSNPVLNERLRAMVRYGMVARFPLPPPSKAAEYRLTPRGKKVLQMLDIIDQLDD